MVLDVVDVLGEAEVQPEDVPLARQLERPVALGLRHVPAGEPRKRTERGTFDTMQRVKTLFESS